MTIKPLYTGAGVSFSTKNKPGRTLTDFSRLIADDEKLVTDGEVSTKSVDVKNENIPNWYEIDAEEEQ